MASKILSGLAGLLLASNVQAQDTITTNQESYLLNTAAKEVRASGSVTGYITKEDGSMIPHTIVKTFSDGKDSVRVRVYDHNQNEIFDQGDVIEVGDPENNPSYEKSLDNFKKKNSWHDETLRQMALKGHFCSTDPSFNEKKYRSRLLEQVRKSTEQKSNSQLERLRYLYHKK